MGNRNGNCKYEDSYSYSPKRREKMVGRGDLLGKDCGDHGDGASLKLVKLVLTRGELELLLQSLKEEMKTATVSDVLGEIELGRERRKERSDHRWKPSLECIVEGHEGHIFVA